MKLIVNGQEREMHDGATVADLVRELGLHKAVVAVEVNKQVVPRASHKSTPLTDRDVIEVVTLVGGG